MTDKQLLDWLEREQACIFNANHKFYVEIYSDPDPYNKDSLRRAIERRAKRGKKPDDE
jgi:hypothetical protein